MDPATAHGDDTLEESWHRQKAVAKDLGKSHASSGDDYSRKAAIKNCANCVQESEAKRKEHIRAGGCAIAIPKP